MTTVASIVCFLFAVLITTAVVFGCKCGSLDRPVAFCDADVVFKVKVLSVVDVNVTSEIPGDTIGEAAVNWSWPSRQYNVKIMESFRKNRAFRDLLRHKPTLVRNETVDGQSHLSTDLFSPVAQASCGVELAVQTEYLIAAFVSDENVLKIHRCSWNEPWSEVTAEDKGKLSDHTFEASCF